MSAYADILAAIEARLGQILVANGYRTDAGAAVWKNLEYQTAPPQKPCLIYYPGELSDSLDGDPAPGAGEENHLLPVEIEGFISDTERGDAAEALKLDILQALKADPYFGGLTEGWSGAITSSSTVEDGGAEGFIGFAKASVTLFYVTPWGSD